MNRTKANINTTAKQDAHTQNVHAMMHAASAALSTIPDNIVRLPKSAAQAFLLTDDVLASLHKSLNEARKNKNALGAFAHDDCAMVEAIDVQIAALEDAYNNRLAALKRKRAKGRADLRAPTKKQAKKTAHKPLEFAKYAKRKKNDDWLFFVALMLIMRGQRRGQNAPALRLA